MNQEDGGTPAFGEPVTDQGPDAAVLRFLARRRSAPAKTMGPPGPGREEVDRALTLAARAPDHGKLHPWRFIVIEGAARGRLGEAFATRHKALHPNADEGVLAVEAARLLRAPVVVAVVFSPKESAKIPEWEQILSAGAVCQNLLIAFTAMGWGAQWLTEWIAYDADAAGALGLGAAEKIAGFVHAGTPSEPPRERARPDLAALVTRITD